MPYSFKDELNPKATEVYFALFYNRNFQLNVAQSLQLTLPLLGIESLGNRVNFEKLLTQIIVLLYASFLYQVVYVVNDLVDFAIDIRDNTLKSSLISRTGSRFVGALFLAWAITPVAILFFSEPHVGTPFGYYVLLLIVSSLAHSFWSSAKPVTLFVERAIRCIGTPLLIYICWPNLLTAAFLLSSVVAYPFVMHGEYLGYLQVKRSITTELFKRSFVLYFFYFVVVILLLLAEVLGTTRTQLHQHLQAVLWSGIGAPLLFTIYSSYDKALWRVSRRHLSRWRTASTPMGKFLTLRLVSTSAITVILLLYAYGK
jgi:hypothetical protein